MVKEIRKTNAFGQGDLYEEEKLTLDVLKRYTRKVNVTRSQRMCSATRSKGNQLKWMKDNKFIKLDCLGYEGLTEVFVCWFLKFVKNLKYDYVRYYPCLVIEDGVQLGYGCVSDNFIGDDEEITFANILESNFKSFGIHYDDLLDLVDDETGLYLKDWVDTILCLDAITRNEDRHFGNFSLLCGETTKCAPIFDNGSACLSDTVTYPLTADFEVCIKNVQAKPFSMDFKNQLYNARRLLVASEDFIASVEPEGDPELERAFRTIKYGLQDTEGVAWEKC